MASRPKLPKLKFDICKIDTTRLRALSTEQLKTTQYRFGRLFDFPKKEQGAWGPTARPRYTVAKFVSDLIGSRDRRELSPRSAEAYRKAYKEEPMPQNEITQMYEREADRTEKLIWDMQLKHRCKIVEQELVARDAIREREDTATAAKLRAERRRPPTPHKRPAKISGRRRRS